MFLPRRRVVNVALFRAPAYGLLALSLAPGLISFYMLQSLVSVLEQGTGVWLASILPVVASAGVFIVALMSGLLRRKAWYGVVALPLAWLLIAAYAAGVVLDLSILAGLLPMAHPDYRFINVVNILLWLVFSPLVWTLWQVAHKPAWRVLPDAQPVFAGD